MLEEKTEIELALSGADVSHVVEVCNRLTDQELNWLYLIVGHELKERQGFDADSSRPNYQESKANLIRCYSGTLISASLQFSRFPKFSGLAEDVMEILRKQKEVVGSKTTEAIVKLPEDNGDDEAKP